MTRASLQAYIDALTDAQIAPLVSVHIMDGAAADAMVAASNAKDAAIHAFSNPLTVDANGVPVKDANGNYQGGQIAVAVQVQKDADATAQAEAVKAATDPLNATIATLMTELATANGTIATQAATITQLQAVVNGNAKAYFIIPTPLQQASLEMEAATRGVTVQALIEVDCGFDADALASTHKQALLAQALAIYPTLPAATQAMILTKLKMSAFINASMEAQTQALGSMALPAFNDLPPDEMNEIIVALPGM